VVVLAVKVLRDAGAVNLAGKAVIDATNPIVDDPPTNGVLRFFTNLDDSLMERLQREFERVRFVKAFNSVGHAHGESHVQGRDADLFICGNDEAAKKIVRGILDQFGWKTADMDRSRRPARSRRSACTGASLDFFGTNGCMRLSC
jgi:8-hydroxy-5-deazaflavin:NADPH oxidoreductase